MSAKSSMAKKRFYNKTCEEVCRLIDMEVTFPPIKKVALTYVVRMMFEESLSRQGKFPKK